MKLIITTLTMVFVNSYIFGSSVFFSYDRCNAIFKQADKNYELMLKEFGNQNFKNLEFFEKKLVNLATIYQAFCKED